MSGRNLTLFLIVAVLALRWIAVAAAAGPSSLVMWAGTALLLFVPLVVCVLELGRRYPEEGGLYAWVGRAFGEYPAFVTGWTYWASNLPYFPGVLYFAAGNVLLAVPGGVRYSDSPGHIAGIALLTLVVTIVPNVLGIVPAADETRPWLAVAKLVILTVVLVAVGTVLYLRASLRRSDTAG